MGAKKANISERVAIAAEIVNKYEHPQGRRAAVRELLSDLRHLCLKEGYSFSELSLESYYAYRKEQGMDR